MPRNVTSGGKYFASHIRLECIWCVLCKTNTRSTFSGGSRIWLIRLTGGELSFVLRQFDMLESRFKDKVSAPVWPSE